MKNIPKRRLSKYLGTWRIIEMDTWDQDFVDLDGPGMIRIGRDGNGELKFGAVEVQLDCRVHMGAFGERLEYSFQGNDEGDEVCGRGGVSVEGDNMTGHIYFHMGEDSGFKAKHTKG